jgi:purine-binding chemotaxis protein CheW
MDELQQTTQLQFLKFHLTGQNYAFDVLKVHEVLSLVQITPLPNAMDFLSGVMNLRGSVIPVVDLRKKFGMPKAETTADSSIIIVDLVHDGEPTMIGALVDAVKGVLRCENKDLEPPPRFGMQLNTHIVQSISKKDGEFVVILDTDNVFSDKELWLIREQATGETPESGPDNKEGPVA